MRRGNLIGAAVLAALVVLALPASALGLGPLSSFGTFGSGVGQLARPGNVAIGSDGSAYVADYDNNRIAVFSPAGIFERAFGAGVIDSAEALQVCTMATLCRAGNAGEGAGAMDRPVDLAFGPEGDLFVADQNNNRVDVFSAGGAFVRAFGREVAVSRAADICTAVTGCKKGATGGSSGALDLPQGLAFGPGRDLYVADTNDARIAVFTPESAFVRAFGKEVNEGPGDADVCTALCRKGKLGEGAGEMSAPYDLVAGPGGLLAVTDRGNNRVDVFSAEGSFVRAFGAEVNAEIGGGDVCASECKQGEATGSAGALAGPTAAAADASGNLYVADTGNNRVAELSFTGAFIRAFGEGVLDGAEAFQVCGAGAECQLGLKGTIAGSTPEPFGVAVDCRGSVYVVEEDEATGFARVELFGDVAVPPPCTQAGESVRVTLRKFVPSSRFRLRVELNPQRGTATAVVIAPPAGEVLLRGSEIRRLAKLSVPHGSAGPTKCSPSGRCTRRDGPSGARLSIKPVGEAKLKLNETGEVKVRLNVTYTPDGGAPRTKHRTLTLRKPLKSR